MKDQLTHSFCKDISLLKKGLLLGFFLLAVTTLSAQIREIKGIVTSETSEPLPGVAVQIDASGTGTVTNIDGQYSISARKGDKITSPLSE